MSIDLRDPLYKISLNYLKKEAYSGSGDGIRFMLKKEAAPEGEGDVLEVWIWPEPLSFEKTDEEKRSKKVFSFDKEGLDAAVDMIMGMLSD